MKGLISEELAAFLESGLSIVVATRDGELQPDGAAAWAARVHADRTHVTLFFYEDAAARVLRNLKDFPQIAIDFDRPTTHRACQVKGELISSRPAGEEDRPEIERQIDAFSCDLEAIGIPRAMFAGWKTWPCTAMQVRATALFEQTPGPGTGERLR